MGLKRNGKDSKVTSQRSRYYFPKSFEELDISFLKLYFRPKASSVISDQIIIIDKFFNEQLCHELIKSFLDSSNLRMETTPIKSREFAARVNDRAQTYDYDASSALWKYLKLVLFQELAYEDDDDIAIKSAFKKAILLNSNLRIYRYGKGQFFDKHYDDSVSSNYVVDRKEKKGRTEWTLLIYLTGGDEYKGGGTIFYPDDQTLEPINIHAKKGMALLHRHGDDCLLHEGELVEEGEKWVLRSDVVFPL